MKSEFLTELDGRYMKDDVRFILKKELVYQSVLLNGILRMPEGFITDFASVPRLPIVYLLFGNRAHHESVPHDFIYQKHEVIVERVISGKVVKVKVKLTRKQGDELFLEAMKCRNKKPWIRNSMYAGVRLGGWNSYRTGPKRCIILNEEN